VHYAASSSDFGGVGIVIYVIVALAITVFEIAACWRVFAKAGKPGWAAIVPFYNLYMLLKIAGRPGWWLLLLVVPVLNVVVSAIVFVDVARSFGRGTGFGIVGLWLFGFVGFPILGFGDARYSGPSARRSVATG